MSEATLKNISQDLRPRREEAGLSREGLAYKAGISVKTVERLEAGKSVPRRATLAVINNALDEALIAVKDGEAKAEAPAA